MPTAARPLRAKATTLAADTRVEPHRHDWAQLVFSGTGVIRLTAGRGTFIAPPSRAVWIPPGVEHAITVVEACALHTLYLHAPHAARGPAWPGCRVLEVTDLLRALVIALPTQPDSAGPPGADALKRERLIAPLLRDELLRAQPLPLGLELPADKRLRALCEAVLDQPTRHATLEAWAADAGASARTLARLFRSELGTSFGQWRQQAALARAMTLAARGHAMNHIAGELGYASASAFSAMVRRSVGAPPRRFFTSS